MKSSRKVKTCRAMTLLAGVLAGIFMIQTSVYAQETAPTEEESVATAQLIAPENGGEGAERVTINVKDANITEVLKAYSLQTGQSIVVGPDVIAESVNVRLNDIPWQDALDVILKPYGFGYRVVGETIVVSRLEKIMEVEGIEPLVSKVFKLKYLDAYDVKDVCEAQLTSRGKFTILTTKGLPGWKFGTGSSSTGSGGGAASSLGTQERSKKEDINKSKTIVVTDVPSAVASITTMIEELDQVPSQVLIEAQFLEIGADAMKDIGLDFITGLEELQGAATAAGTGASIDDVQSILTLTQGFPNSLTMRGMGSYGMDNGLRLSHTELGESGIEVLVRLIQEDEDANILSAPRVLTLDNHEAAILVGRKYPIIESDVTGESSTRSSISLEYYENIGIQLNVIPQICDNDYINMIVHPAVSEIEGFTSGGVAVAGIGQGTSGTTSYPILTVREAETQILIKSEDTTVIGGLQQERDVFTVKRVPFLGDIPYLGRLFRREIMDNEKTELLIFIKASIIEPEAYAIESKNAQDSMQKAAGFGPEETVEEVSEETVDPIEPTEDVPVEEPVVAEEIVPATETEVTTSNGGEAADVSDILNQMSADVGGM